MARPKKKVVKKARVGGPRKSAGRKSVEVHFAALDEKVTSYRAELEQMFNVFHSEVVKIDSTLTQMGQLLFGQRPVALPVSPQVQPSAPVLPLQVTSQNGDPTGYQVRFQPPVKSQPLDAHGNPIQQS